MTLCMHSTDQYQYYVVGFTICVCKQGRQGLDQLNYAQTNIYTHTMLKYRVVPENVILKNMVKNTAASLCQILVKF